MTLFQHQSEGAAEIARTGKYNGDEPGLGKTRTQIEALRLRGAKHPLIVCPAIVRTHWLKEFDALRWFEHSQRPIVRSYEEIVRGGDRLMAQLLLGNGVDSIVLDEAHYLKHATSKRTIQLLGRDGYARRLEHVLPASGTPVPKNPLEFATVLIALYPEIAREYGVPTIEKFKDRFCIARGMFVRGAWREKILAEVKEPDVYREMLSRVLLRRTNDQLGLDVPRLWFQQLRIDAAGVNTSTGTDREMWIQGIVDRIEAGELELIANDPHVARMRRRLGEIKAPAMAEMVKADLEDSDEKLVLFAHHTDVIEAMRAALLPFAVVVDGSVSQRKRDAAIDRFQHDKNVRVFIGQNMACQTGLDGLQHAAKRAILVEPDWTADVNYQLGKRIARIGSIGGVAIAQMACLAGTLDEAIVRQNIKETRLAAELGLGRAA